MHALIIKLVLSLNAPGQWALFFNWDLGQGSYDYVQYLYGCIEVYQPYIILNVETYACILRSINVNQNIIVTVYFIIVPFLAL